MSLTETGSTIPEREGPESGTDPDAGQFSRKKRGHRGIKPEMDVDRQERGSVIIALTYKTERSMKAIGLIFGETLTEGQFEMKSRVLIFVDEAGNGYSDTFSEVRHNGRLEAYRYNGTEYRYMQDLMEA